MALEFAAEAYEKEIWEIDEPADGESNPDEEKKEPEDRLIMKTGSLIKYLTEKKTEGIQAEKISLYLSSKAGRPHNLTAAGRSERKQNVIVWH